MDAFSQMIFERGLGIGERQGIAIGKTHASDDLRGAAAPNAQPLSAYCFFWLFFVFVQVAFSCGVMSYFCAFIEK